MFSNLFTRGIALCSSKRTRSNRNAVKISMELTLALPPSLPPFVLFVFFKYYYKATRFGFHTGQCELAMMWVKESPPPTVVCRFLQWAAICTCQIQNNTAGIGSWCSSSSHGEHFSTNAIILFILTCHTLPQTENRILYITAWRGESAALTYLYKALTLPDSIFSDSEIGPPFFHIHIYLN